MGRLSEILQECLQKSKNASIYRQIGRNRPIDAFNPHQRLGLNTSDNKQKFTLNHTFYLHSDH